MSASGQVRETVLTKADGEHTQVFTPTGRVQKELVSKPDGSRQSTQYAPNGKVQKSVLMRADGVKESTQVRYGRNGQERVRETVKVDARGREVSKTVIVKQTTVISRNTTVLSNPVIVKNYYRGSYGFVYRPDYAVASAVLSSWYNPYWYDPVGVDIVRPFHYSWAWNDYPWYRANQNYWAAYDIYPTPSHWVTDWMVAGYIADRFSASASADQAREEARLAREEAQKARAVAAAAVEASEIAEAQRARDEADARVAMAEASAAQAEAREAKAVASSSNPDRMPIDPQTKEVLRTQIEQAVAEKKALAEQAAKGGSPMAPDLGKSLADPKHIYAVSHSTSVISPVDQTPAGMLAEGDLLRLEAGQADVLKNSNENTFVTVRVMASPGETGEVKAGTLVSIPLKSLQDFESEFQAKLDLGLAEADKNKELFVSGAL